MVSSRKRKTSSRSQRTLPDRTLGVTLLSAGAAAIGIGAAVVALLLRRRPDLPTGHAAADLAPDRPVETATTAPSNAPTDAAAASAERAPEHFRPDATAVPTAEEREALRPATGPAPGFAADRGSLQADPQDAA